MSILALLIPMKNIACKCNHFLWVMDYFICEKTVK